MLSPEISAIMRDYQKEAFEFMTAPKPYISQPNTKAAALMYDDMGLGKTLVTLCAIDHLEAFPCLIIAPKFAHMVWQHEIKKWLGYDSVIYTGRTPQARGKRWAEFINKDVPFLITNYEMLTEVARRTGFETMKGASRLKPTGTFDWNAIVWDEIHMGGLFNHKTTAYKISEWLARRIPVRYLLTGTPYRQGCVDLFAPLSLIDRIKFDSYWRFVNKYAVVIQTPFGKSIERNPANIVAFREMLNLYMIRRTKEEKLPELPGKLRQPLFIEMNKEQQQLYDELTENLLAFIPDTDDLLITPNQMTLIVRQRQILACPQELGLKEPGAAIEAIVDHSHLKLDFDQPVVVFTPFRKALPYLRKAFEKEYPLMPIYEIKGQMTPEQFGEAWMTFQNTRGKRILLCVIKSGASFQATAADTGYFLGYEWDFNLNEQSEDRLNRFGQDKFVNIFYVMVKGTVDDDIADRLNEKKASSDWVVGTQAQYLKRLRQVQGG